MPAVATLILLAVHFWVKGRAFNRWWLAALVGILLVVTAWSGYLIW